MPPHRRDRPVDRCRKNAVPIVEDEAVGRLGGDDHAKLLNRPFCGGMLRDVPVEDPPRTDLEDDEDIKDAKANGHRREEVTGDDRLRMISHKCRPPLGPRLAAPGRRVRRYRPTVRGDTVKPSFRRSSFAIRSSPQVGFAWAMPTISRCKSLGIGGRPGRDSIARRAASPGGAT